MDELKNWEPELQRVVEQRDQLAAVLRSLLEGRKTDGTFFYHQPYPYLDELLDEAQALLDKVEGK
jgi:hypothetical protein